MKCDDPNCEAEVKPYPTNHGPWISVYDLKDRQRFALPDFHGGYGICCSGQEPAVYEHHSGDVFESYFQCVKCAERTLYCNTFVQTAELRE